MTLKGFLKKIKLSEQTISMVLGLMVIVVMGLLIVNYFRGTGVKQPGSVTTPTNTVEQGGVKLIEEDGKQVPANLPTTHKVAKGESLWQIAEKYYGSGYNWVDVARENGLKNANYIEADQELSIPRVEVKKPTAALTSQSTKTNEVLGQSIQGDTYTVVKGDSLWTISVRAYQDGYRWTEIAKANNIQNPGVIHSGNVLKLPR